MLPKNRKFGENSFKVKIFNRQVEKTCPNDNILRRLPYHNQADNDDNNKTILNKILVIDTIDYHRVTGFYEES